MPVCRLSRGGQYLERRVSQSIAIPPHLSPPNPKEWEETGGGPGYPGHRDYSGFHHGGTDGLTRVERSTLDFHLSTSINAQN